MILLLLVSTNTTMIMKSRHPEFLVEPSEKNSIHRAYKFYVKNSVFPGD